MPEVVKIREDLQIIQVDSYGDVSADDLRQSLMEVSELQRQKGLNRVFVDATRETSLPSTVPLFEFGADLADSFHDLIFAVAVSPRMKGNLHFLETVTRNRGMHVRMFNNVNDALAWLTALPES